MTYEEFEQRYQYNPESDQLGEGGFGVVYKALDTHRNRYVAIKESQIKTNRDKFTLQREVELANEIKPHPNIARYINCWRFKITRLEMEYAVMPYYSYGNLTDVIKRKLTSTEKEAIIKGIMLGLKHLHNEDIIHRDLKTPNILMERENGKWVPKIADFGLGKMLTSSGGDGSRSNSSIFLTYSYAAPEQINPKRFGRTIRKNVDLWALGVIIWEIFLSKRPFDPPESSYTDSLSRESEIKNMIQSLGYDKAALSRIPLLYQKLIRRCLVLDKSERAQSVEELLSLMPHTSVEPPTEKHYTDPNVTDPNATVGQEDREKEKIVMEETLPYEEEDRKESVTEEHYVPFDKRREKKEEEVKETEIVDSKKEKASKKGFIRPIVIVGLIAVLLTAAWKGYYELYLKKNKSKENSDNVEYKYEKYEDKSIGLVHILQGDSYNVMSVCYSPDGKYIVSGGWDRTIKVWNSRTGALLHTLQGHSKWVYSVSYSPDGKYIVSGSIDNTIKVWNSRTGTLLHTLQGHSDDVNSVSYSPDGQYIVSGSNDNTIKVWNSRTGTLLHTLQGHSDWVWSVCYSPDGQYIVSGSDDNTIKVWNSRTGALLHTLKGHDGVSVSYSPDGQYIVSGSYHIKIWDSRTGALLHTLQGHSEVIYSVSYSPDGQYIVSGSEDKTIKVWNSRMGALLHTFQGLQGHSSVVWSVCYSPDGKYIISGSGDKTIKVWDVGLVLDLDQ